MIKFLMNGLSSFIWFCRSKGRASHPYRVPSLDALSCITLWDRSVILFCISKHIPLECSLEKK